MNGFAKCPEQSVTSLTENKLLQSGRKWAERTETSTVERLNFSFARQ